MEAINRKSPGQGATSKTVLDANHEQKNLNTKSIPHPKKSEIVLENFLKHRSLNTFQANKLYGDTCLHSAVSTLEKKYGIRFKHTSERVMNRIGKPVRVMRYKLLDEDKARNLHSSFQRDRGISKGVQ